MTNRLDEMVKKNELLEITIQLALSLIEYCEILEKEKKFVVATQLLKSGTSIGANAHEAQGAESRNDFVHKLKVAYKEAKETAYWILLCTETPSYPNPPVEIEHRINSVLNILGKIISKTKTSVT